MLSTLTPMVLGLTDCAAMPIIASGLPWSEAVYYTSTIGRRLPIDNNTGRNLGHPNTP